MDGIFFVLRTGTPWRDLPERCGPCTTCFNRYNRWSRNGLREKIMSKLQELAEGGDNDGGGGRRGASPAHGGFLVDPRPQARRGRPTGRRASRGRD